MSETLKNIKVTSFNDVPKVVQNYKVVPLNSTLASHGTKEATRFKADFEVNKKS
jgi:hypothetical protein